MVTLHAPTSTTSISSTALRPMPGTMKSLGVLDNQKQNASHILEALADLLTGEFPGMTVTIGRKLNQSLPATEEIVRRLSTGDIVLNGVGD